MRSVLAAAVLGILWAGIASGAQGYFELPPLPAPAQYGNLLIDRASTKHGQKAVTFSHWSHRMRHTCRVCHLELEFEMRVNATTIAEADNQKGKYCGACHDGRIAFGHTKEHCRKCHNGNLGAGTDAFLRLARLLPKARFGNEVDWVQALARSMIKPRQSIRDFAYKPKAFDSAFDLKPGWELVPSARFSHAVHNRWLDCANCHPDLFAVKRNATKHFEMRYILDGRFCGACHLKVAFPVNDCSRCHPAMSE